MQIHQGDLLEITRYLQNNQQPLQEKEAQYQTYLRLLCKGRPINSTTRVLEVGTGTGWFPILCKMRGVPCKGLEISTQLIEHAREIGRSYGAEPDIELGNVEDSEIGFECYDAIVAVCVFEHVEHWQKGLQKLYTALKPGGAMLFMSTNEFYIGHSEYPWAFYGCLPDQLRYRFRVARQGPEIMKLGIDFNQFRHSQLRRAFRNIGFDRILDRIDLLCPDDVTGSKRLALRILKALGPAGKLALTFADTTLFACVK
jgi:SAM-dependent methyltransferase